MEATLIFVIMGVSGCGKSTVAALLAERLGCAFYEGDSYHPPANIAKMHAGTPLCDEDRWPWLQQLADILQHHLSTHQPAVLSCSALKPAYRQLLRTGRRREEGHSRQNGSSSSRIGGTAEPGGSRSCGAEEFNAGRAGPSSAAASAGQGAVAGLSGSSGLAHGVGSSRHDCRPGSSVQDEPVAFVLLDPPRELLKQRLQQRTTGGDHFMPAALLDSQLEALQYTPSDLYLHVQGRPFPQPQQIVDAVLHRLKQL